jgi:hypothetical protein
VATLKKACLRGVRTSEYDKLFWRVELLRMSSRLVGPLRSRTLPERLALCELAHYYISAASLIVTAKMVTVKK